MQIAHDDEERRETNGVAYGAMILFVAYASRDHEGEELIRLFRHGGRTPMREGTMKRISRIPTKLSKKLEHELKALEGMSDDGIDYSDIPPRTDWSGAVVGRFYRPIKKPLTVRIDADVLEWLRSKGAGYQTRLNGILRRAMLEEKPLRVVGSKRPRKKFRQIERRSSGQKRAAAR